MWDWKSIKIQALKQTRDQLKADKDRLYQELESANEKIIQHEIRQKDQQDTITRLFKVSFNVNDVNHFRYHGVVFTE